MALGKPKYIETPEKMWEYFISYRDNIKSHPLHKNDFAGKDADEVIKKLERPLTMEGFENWLFNNDIITDVSDYFENTDKRYSDYLPICRAIRRTIRQDQIEGGMAGIYNPSITQRLNGLVDKTQADDKHEIKINVSRGNRHKAE